MCGIAGAVSAKGAPIDRAVVSRMVQLLSHRGPDETGVYVSGTIGLGHARLSIVDLENGQQPMASADGQVWLVFNGEIFNHVEIRAELESRGHVFRTRSDTEVLLHAYLEYGKECVRHFNGQWAFAIWDGRQRRLFASRDRMGIRPFYYARNASHLVFGSEIKAVFAFPGITREIDVEGLDQILNFWTTVPPRTFFKGVEELPAGCSLVFESSRLTVERYFEIDYSDMDERSEDDLAEELMARLVDAARLRFQRADVPVGAYLSGGLDSTVITGIVRNYLDVPLETFSVTFDQSEFDESAHQKLVREHLGVSHHEVLCRSEDIGRVFPEVMWHTEQPVIRTAPAPMFLLSKLVRESGYKVVLTGEGADELLGGYDIFKEAKVRRFCARQPDSRRRSLLLRKLYPYIPGIQAQPDAYLRSFFRARAEDLADPFFSHLPRWELTGRLSLFYSRDLKSRLEVADPRAAVREQLPPRYSEWPPFCQAQHLETHYLLPGYILSSQGDRMGMAHSVEGRFPFLDHRVVQLASRIRPELKMRVLNEKYLLKKAAGDIIPAALRERPKQPYRAPEAISFFDGSGGRARFEWIEELLDERSVASSGLWNPKAVHQLTEKARRGKVVGIKDGMSLVAILSTQLVWKQFVERFGKESCGH